MPNQTLLHSPKIIKFTLALLVSLGANLAFSLTAKAEPMFEGYYKVNLSGVHSGYVIQRYEFDDKKKQFTGSYFAYIRLSPDGKQFLNESLVAKSTDGFQPISYEYSKLATEPDPTKPGKMKSSVSTIDAKFKKVMAEDFQIDENGRQVRDKKGKPVKIKVEKLQGTLTGMKDGKNFSSKPILRGDIFLSNFLLYLMLQKGFKVGRGFSFEALAEESGDPAKGTVKIESETKYKEIPAYKIDWTYNGQRSVSFISLTGEALSTESPTQGVTQELVASKAEALADFPQPTKSINATFGGVPEGKINAMTKKKTAPAAQPATQSPPQEKPMESLNPTKPEKKTPEQ